MKRNFILVLGLALTGLLATRCLRDACTSVQRYVRFDPVYKTVGECRKDLSVESPRALRKPGKFYALGQYMLINEFQEGIHIIDNSDPSNPKALAFWNIPGNVDIAVYDSKAYLDQYMDLITVDVTNLLQPVQLCREEEAFPLFGSDPVRGYIVDYTQSDVEEEVPCNGNGWGNWVRRGDVILADAVFAGNFASAGSAVASSGIAGSYARFGIAEDHLYTVDNSTLISWKTGSGCPQKLGQQFLGFQAETIFPYENHLFVGARTGMFVFNNSNPAALVQEGGFMHATGCDPVVCRDDLAFVTVHGGTTCNGGNINQLDVVSVKNLPQTTLIRSYPMTQPKGLALSDKHLYLCDDGLKVFDRSDALNMKQLVHLSGIKVTDAILLREDLLLLIGEDGFRQYDVSAPGTPKLVSHIPVQF